MEDLSTLFAIDAEARRLAVEAHREDLVAILNLCDKTYPADALSEVVAEKVRGMLAHLEGAD